METLVSIADAFIRQDTYEALSESARFLYVYNSTTLIASVGAIVGLILLGSLIWIAVTSALKTDNIGNSGGYSSGGYRKRRHADDEEQTVSFLAALNDVFQKFSIDSFDCRRRAVCEAHLNGALEKFGPLARHIANTTEKFIRSSIDQQDMGHSYVLNEYLKAVHHGRKNENCAHYDSCVHTLRDFALKTANQNTVVMLTHVTNKV